LLSIGSLSEACLLSSFGLGDCNAGLGEAGKDAMTIDFIDCRRSAFAAKLKMVMSDRSRQARWLRREGILEAVTSRADCGIMTTDTTDLFRKLVARVSIIGIVVGSLSLYVDRCKDSQIMNLA